MDESRGRVMDVSRGRVMDESRGRVIERSVEVERDAECGTEGMGTGRLREASVQGANRKKGCEQKELARNMM